MTTTPVTPRTPRHAGDRDRVRDNLERAMTVLMRRPIAGTGKRAAA
mgnify:CR=1 FL=1